MKKIRTITLSVFLSMGTLSSCPAQDIPGIGSVTGLAKRAIKALDLQVQRLQNKTIGLQNVQKAIENVLSKLKLDEISDWAAKQKEQYRQYYEELAAVKTIVSYYQRIHAITDKQVRLVDAYNRCWQLLRQDNHFTQEEINYMATVYSGILKESLQNMDQILLVVRSFATSMSDAQRLELINHAADQVDENYDDLNRFNTQNKLLSLERSKTRQEAETVKKIYGFI